MADQGRGTYRGIFSSLFDDPEYQRLSSSARLLLLTARQCHQAGPGAIFRFYPEVLCRQTGFDAETVERSLEELTREGWIEQDGVIIWVRNGLRYDPSMRLSDTKHRKSVEKSLFGLPRRPIVLKFCDYYQITRPFDAPSEGHRWPIEGVARFSPPNPNPNPNTESDLAREGSPVDNSPPAPPHPESGRSAIALNEEERRGRKGPEGLGEVLKRVTTKALAPLEADAEVRKLER